MKGTMKTWVAVMNRTEARFFEINEKEKNKLKLLKKVANPRGRLKNSEINADRPGVNKFSFAYSQTSLTKPQKPTDRVAQIFAKDVSEELERGFNAHLFQNLILVAEPHFLGKIRAALSKKTFETVSSTLPKDLVHVSDHDLSQLIWHHMESTVSL
ncbi:MAG TPA: host attachment protein [Pseudobdellovibrionaceae bacterium]|jgi:protein required for attachment to host cells